MKRLPAHIILITAFLSATTAVLIGCGQKSNRNPGERSQSTTIGAPTQADEAGIKKAIPEYFLAVQEAPEGCVVVSIKMSMNRQYARVSLRSLTPKCRGYGGNSFEVLHRRGRKWTVVFQGSYPPCSLRIPRELAVCYKQ